MAVCSSHSRINASDATLDAFFSALMAGVGAFLGGYPTSMIFSFLGVGAEASAWAGLAANWAFVGVGAVGSLLAQKASEGAQRTKKAVEKLSKQCLELMYGKKAADAVNQLGDKGKYRDLKVIDLRDKNVASDPAYKKYVEYANKNLSSPKNAITYKREAECI